MAGFPAIPPPPRRTGEDSQDMAAFAQWFYHFYTATIVQGGLLSAETQAETQEVDPENPPSPTATTLATAQSTANIALAAATGTAGLFPPLTGHAQEYPRINTAGNAFEYVAASSVVSAGGGVPQTRTLTAGIGLSGGGDLSGNRTFTVDFTYVVPTDRTITAGTGLTGGGNLTTNRTLSLATDWGSV